MNLAIPSTFYSCRHFVYMHVYIIPHCGFLLQVALSVRYWLINHTGLPLVFKQVSTKASAAGQFEENEIARSVTPCMFSFADKDSPEL